MRVTVVGCSGSFAGPRSAASCYLVQADDGEGRTWNVVLDLGSGAFGPLQAVVDPFDLDAVLLSHLHPDHVADITGLYVYRRYHPSRSGGVHTTQAPLAVWGPAGTCDRTVAMGASDSARELSGTFAFATWSPGTPVVIGPLRIEPFQVNHPVPAYAMRISGPSEAGPTRAAVLTYSGDTDLCAGLRQAAADADVLLCEAAFVEGRDDGIEGLHLTGMRAGTVARDAGVARLLLTHIPPWNDRGIAVREARAVFGGPVAEVEAGQVVAF